MSVDLWLTASTDMNITAKVSESLRDNILTTNRDLNILTTNMYERSSDLPLS